MTTGESLFGVLIFRITTTFLNSLFFSDFSEVFFYGRDCNPYASQTDTGNLPPVGERVSCAGEKSPLWLKTTCVCPPSIQRSPKAV